MKTTTLPASRAWPAGLTLAGRPMAPHACRVTVLGGGVMGPGIAMVFAEHGFQVDVCDISQTAAAKAHATLVEALQLKAELGLLDADAARDALARVTIQVGSEKALKGAAFVIEAVSENREVKTAVYEDVCRWCEPDAVVWSNTSTMDVFALAPETLRSRLLVAHWFAPPHILPLVELVGQDPEHAVLMDESEAILKALGKAPVRLEKFVPGFIINRLLRALGREAFDLIESGAITIENLDIAVRTSLAPRMQILGLMQRYDFTGLNLSLRNLEDRAIVDAPVNLAPESLVGRVQRGELGVTTGKGFYDYQGRSLSELQRLRDAKLWQVVQGVGDLIQDPRPL